MGLNVSGIHDATLREIRVDFQQGIVVLEIATCESTSRRATLRFEQLLDLHCPRLGPWGPSSSSNEVREQLAEGVRVTEIEMQSGDVITIRARQEVSVHFR